MKVQMVLLLMLVHIMHGAEKNKSLEEAIRLCSRNRSIKFLKKTGAKRASAHYVVPTVDVECFVEFFLNHFDTFYEKSAIEECREALSKDVPPGKYIPTWNVRKGLTILFMAAEEQVQDSRLTIRDQLSF